MKLQLRFEAALRGPLGGCLLCAALLGGCATEAGAPSDKVARLLDDSAFTPVSDVLTEKQIFAPSEEMREYLASAEGFIVGDGPRYGLIRSLYKTGNLRLEFDSDRTRTAAEAFHDRLGNCLSLVIMTGSLARELHVPVHYRRVRVEATWNRAGGTYLGIGHVNLLLGAPGRNEILLNSNYKDDLVVDFLPSKEASRLPVEDIDESRVAAMFMNNRAVEWLTRGNVNEAYWWVRAAIQEDASYATAYNTLGVVYQRHGQPAQAERVFTALLETDVDDTSVMSNLAVSLDALGQTARAAQVRARVLALNPDPPYHDFELGEAAMRAADYTRARDLFQREVEHDPYNDDFHFALARAEAALGHIHEAREQLEEALTNSSSRHNYGLYAAKLERLKELGVN